MNHRYLWLNSGRENISNWKHEGFAHDRWATKTKVKNNINKYFKILCGWQELFTILCQILPKRKCVFSFILDITHFCTNWIWHLLSENSLQWSAAAAAKSLQSCLTLCDPIDGSPPGSPVPGILQARTLEWVAISFSLQWSTTCKRICFSCQKQAVPSVVSVV